MDPQSLDAQLLNAAWNGEQDRIAQLLASGASADAKDNFFRTALHVAAQEGHVEACRTLLAQGATLEACTTADATPLRFAIVNGRIDVCRLLLEAGANVHTMARTQSSALHGAAIHGDVTIIQLLLAHGANPAAQDCDERTPLHDAVRTGKIAAAHFFLEECGEDLDQTNARGQTLEELARWAGQAEMAAFLSAYRHSLSTGETIAAALGMEDEALPAVKRMPSPL